MEELNNKDEELAQKIKNVVQEQKQKMKQNKMVLMDVDKIISIATMKEVEGGLVSDDPVIWLNVLDANLWYFNEVIQKLEEGDTKEVLRTICNQMEHSLCSVLMSLLGKVKGNGTEE